MWANSINRGESDKPGGRGPSVLMRVNVWNVSMSLLSSCCAVDLRGRQSTLSLSAVLQTCFCLWRNFILMPTLFLWQCIKVLAVAARLIMRGRRKKGWRWAAACWLAHGCSVHSKLNIRHIWCIQSCRSAAALLCKTVEVKETWYTLTGEEEKAVDEDCSRGGSGRGRVRVARWKHNLFVFFQIMGPMLPVLPLLWKV